MGRVGHMGIKKNGDVHRDTDMRNMKMSGHAQYAIYM